MAFTPFTPPIGVRECFLVTPSRKGLRLETWPGPYLSGLPGTSMATLIFFIVTASSSTRALGAL